MAAILKYTTSESASTMVVINGLAITAGSNQIFFAISGSEQPTTFAIKTVTDNEMQTVAAIKTVTLSKIIILTKLQTAKTMPHITATRTSFQISFNISENSISFKDKLLIIATED